MSQSPPILKLEGIRKSYGRNTVLKDISLELFPGHFHLLAGPNGAGKSTLLKLLVRQETPDAGWGEVYGSPLHEDRGSSNLEVAYVSESVEYVHDGSLREFFRFYSEFFPNWNKELFRITVDEVGIDLGKNFKDLSRGQRMQVVFGAAIAAQPQILILDEITSVLDSRVRDLFLRYVSNFCAAGKTAILATNIISEATPFADRLLLLERGRIRINTHIQELNDLFFKVIKKPDSDDPIFHNSVCIQVGEDVREGHTIHLVMKGRSGERTLAKEILDDSSVRLEEALTYFTKVEGAEEE